MLIIRIIRFLTGYVCFCASGGFTERFVNLCTGSKIPLWNMKKQGNVLYGETTVDGYKAIRRAAHLSGVKMKITAKRGVPFFLNANRRRCGIAVGLLAAAVVVFFLSTMVWTISVEGNKQLSREEILDVFSQLGVRKGAFAKKIRPSDVSEKAEQMLPELLWASVNIKGSRVEIVVCERIDAPPIEDLQTPCNIVADEDAVIVSIQANIGKEAVRAGDAVVKGDLLISGVTGNLDGSENLKSARGNVVATVSRHLCADCSVRDYYALSEEKTRYSLYFFGLVIPLDFRVGESNYHRSESFLSNGKITLPVGIVREHSFQSGNQVAVPEEYQRLMNADILANEYCSVCREAEISREELTVSGNAFSCEITALRDIGVRQEIFVENQY